MSYSPSSSAKNWQGKLHLIYGKRQGKTLVNHAFASAPLRIQRPFYPEGEGICHSVVLHTAGGIVGGDILKQNLELERSSHALVTTPAAAKVYRSNGQQAQQEIDLKVGENACLEWLPQENIIFNGAVFQQQMKVELAPGAKYLGWEINRFGRTARGEKFLQGNWRSHTEVWQGGKPLWIDRQWLPGSETTFHSANGLAGKPIVGSFVCLGKPVSPEIIIQVQKLWHQGNYQGEGGVTQTQGQGLLCRYRGNSTGEVRHWFTEVWQLLRVYWLELSIVKPRVWL